MLELYLLLIRVNVEQLAIFCLLKIFQPIVEIIAEPLVNIQICLNRLLLICECALEPNVLSLGLRLCWVANIAMSILLRLYLTLNFYFRYLLLIRPELNFVKVSQEIFAIKIRIFFNILIIKKRIPLLSFGWYLIDYYCSLEFIKTAVFVLEIIHNRELFPKLILEILSLVLI